MPRDQRVQNVTWNSGGMVFDRQIAVTVKTIPVPACTVGVFKEKESSRQNDGNSEQSPLMGAKSRAGSKLNAVYLPGSRVGMRNNAVELQILRKQHQGRKARVFGGWRNQPFKAFGK